MTTPRIKARCPGCQHLGKIKRGSLGRGVSCQRCGATFRVSSHVQIPCPRCRLDLRVRPEMMGQLVACKHCFHRFLAQPEGDTLLAPTSPQPPPERLGRVDLAQGPVPSPEAAATGEEPGEARGRIEELQAGERDSLGSPETARQPDRLVETLRSELAEARSELDRLRDRAREIQEQVDGQALLEEGLRAARMEVERLRTALQGARDSAQQAEVSRAGEIEALLAERDRLQAEMLGLRGDRDSLRAEQDRLRDQVVALQEQADHVGPPSTEPPAASAESGSLPAMPPGPREQLAGPPVAAAQAEESLRVRLQRVEEEAEGLRAELEAHQAERAHWERSLAEAQGQHAASLDALARHHEEARGLWEAERRALQERWERERHDLIQAAEQRGGPGHHDEGSGSSEQHLASTEEAERRHRDEVTRLTREASEARSRADDLERRNNRLEAQVEAMRGEIDWRQQGREEEGRRYEEALAALRHELATARAGLQALSLVSAGGPDPPSTASPGAEPGPPVPPGSPPSYELMPPDPRPGTVDTLLSDADSEAFWDDLRSRRR